MIIYAGVTEINPVASLTADNRQEWAKVSATCVLVRIGFNKFFSLSISRSLSVPLSQAVCISLCLFMYQVTYSEIKNELFIESDKYDLKVFKEQFLSVYFFLPLSQLATHSDSDHLLPPIE